ncbi:2-amino-4-hydroxy-6-hydroxymethyldihydropteridine diphosphokinase [Xylanibacter brevis]|uniref:2-amino-4-hydroxy-6- hydroxymethyldihydropteridine diphosphokinase n=1 Tax=Xylanibacter brevis TaxID=83231 RepID=UPI0005C495A2|nr:2-amino-4-hydroxy-6-hydroxymethyldihydropteridine diphosphokinase [Xylanibacter brevis]
MIKLHNVYLGLGSNLGQREENILQAYEHIERLIGHIVCQSAFFYSEPWGFQSAHGFVNTAIRVETSLSPFEVLHQTQYIEHLLGKTAAHATIRQSHDVCLYQDRPIDIDILLYDNLCMDEPELKIPHPLMQEREFVMIPLREVLPITYADREPSQ